MYNKVFMCTYQYYDKRFRDFIIEPFDKNDVEDFESLADDLYRTDLCRATGTDSVNSEMCDTFFQISLAPQLAPCIELAKSIFPVSPEYILFSYDFFFLTHHCICTDFSEDALKRLKAALKHFGR